MDMGNLCFESDPLSINKKKAMQNTLNGFL